VPTAPSTHLYFTLTPAPNPFAPNANPRFFRKDIPVPSHRPYSPASFIARMEIDANDAVEPAEGSGSRPAWDAPDKVPLVWGIRSSRTINPAPRGGYVSSSIHIRGASASGLHPLSTSEIFDIVGEAGGRFRSP
jgi:hypothetical protein